MPDSDRMPRTAMRTVLGSGGWALAAAVGLAATAAAGGGTVGAGGAALGDGAADGAAGPPAQAAHAAATSRPNAHRRLPQLPIARRPPRSALPIVSSSSTRRASTGHTATYANTMLLDRICDGEDN